MNKVAIIDYGCIKFSQDDIPVETILCHAAKKVIIKTNMSTKHIDGILVSSTSNTKYLSAIISDLLKIKPKISCTIENLCSSGTNAIVSAFAYISAGLANAILVVGADRYDTQGKVFEYDKSRGIYTHPIFWASLFTKSYKRKYKITQDDLALISMKNHLYAQDNPYAYSKKAYTINEIINSKKLTDDLRVLDCSRICTGGSAILLVSENFAKKFSKNPVWIKGIGQKTISSEFTKNNNLTSIESTKIAAKNAFTMCKMKPKDIDVAEIHDAFTICEVMAIEDLGFTKKGNGVSFSNELFNTNNKKINPRGGLIGSGHSIGATGISQTIEITQQLQNLAKKRQIKNARLGLVHNMSAAATSSTVLVLNI